MQTKNKTKVWKLWLERLGVALITVLALGTPFLCGFVGYLGLRPEGIFINEGDPLRESHIWIERERRGLMGLGIQTTSPEASPNGTPCYRTHLTFLRWQPQLTLERSSSPCI